MTNEQVPPQKPGVATRRSMLRGLGFTPLVYAATPAIARSESVRVTAGQLIQRIKDHAGGSWSGPAVTRTDSDRAIAGVAA